MAQKIKLKKSSIVDRMPTASTMDYGEVYVNYASGVGKSFLTTVKDGKGSIAKFMEKDYNDATYSTKAEASEYAAAALANAEYYTDQMATTIKTTWSNLKSLRDNSQLNPGQWYRITDYTCTTIQADTQSAGHVFDIIVRADDVNMLNENAFATHHSGDTYFVNSKVEAWELKYCLDNDTNRFAWADSTNGKGVIYWMKDEFGNEAGYDFKNIQMKFYKITAVTTVPSDLNNTYSVSKIIGDNNYTISDGCTIDANDTEFRYTFDLYSSSTHSDYSLNTASSNKAKFCYDNVIPILYGNYSSFGDDVNSKLQWINFISFRGIDYSSLCFSNIFGDRCYNISFGDGCNSNTFGNSCGNNTFGNDCIYNTFGDRCIYNTFGDRCDYNTFGNSCGNNTFGNDCIYNTFGNRCDSNTFGRYYKSNTFGNECQFNTFGNDCFDNTFGNECFDNTFGNFCGPNTFGDRCGYNTFGSNCSSNTFGSNCSSNTFGSNCSSNTFGNSCSYNTFGNYVRQLTVFEGVKYCSVTGGSGSNSYVQNAQILNGTNGSNSSNLLTITFVANANYTQIAGKNSSGVLKIWTPADISTQLDNILTIIQNI